MRPQLAWSAAPVALSGCSLLFSTADLTRDYAGSAVDGGLNETDATVIADAPADIPVATPFCMLAQHLFCDAFDRTTPTSSGWDALEISAGEAAISAERARSASSSLRVKHPGRTSASPASVALLKKDVFAGGGRFKIEFDVYLARPSFTTGDSNIGVVCASTIVSGSRDTVCVSVASTVVTLGSVDRAMDAFDAWVHGTIAMKHGEDATVTLGAETAQTTPIRGSEGGTERLYLGLGLHAYNAPFPPVVAHYDNVVVDPL